MAEQEVIKHTKKIYTTMKDHNTSFWHKLKEFLMEIFIIVFAVTISIWFHNWSEHLQEQRQVREFLLGLRKDIQTDVAQAKDDVVGYQQFGQVYIWVSQFNTNRVPDKDSLHKALEVLNNDITFRTHRARFDGFLSAGKIMSIENDSLSFAILNYYQETLQALKLSESGWISQSGLLHSYILENTKNVEDEMSQWQVLATPKGRFISKGLIPWPQLYERYQHLINEGNSIIQQIDNMYPGKK